MTGFAILALVLSWGHLEASSVAYLSGTWARNVPRGIGRGKPSLAFLSLSLSLVFPRDSHIVIGLLSQWLKEHPELIFKEIPGKSACPLLT